jgi:hypothetical protein
MAHATPTDVGIQAEGTLFLFHLHTDAARTFVAEHVSEESQFFGDALVVEPRYARDLFDGMVEAGLVVRSA